MLFINKNIVIRTVAIGTEIDTLYVQQNSVKSQQVTLVTDKTITMHRGYYLCGHDRM